jgi:hypothetical protein
MRTLVAGKLGVCVVVGTELERLDMLAKAVKIQRLARAQSRCNAQEHVGEHETTHGCVEERVLRGCALHRQAKGILRHRHCGQTHTG